MASDIMRPVADFEPPEPSAEADFAELIDAARLAPSVQDTQPWEFRVGPGRIELFADMQRWLPVTDDDQRALHLSLGCALENLLVAAEHFGLAHEVMLLPRKGRPDLLATVRIHRSARPRMLRDPVLFDAIPVRHTNRDLYAARPVPTEALARLRECILEDDILLRTTTDRSVIDEVAGLVEHGDRYELADPAYRRELADWVGRGAFGTPRVLCPLARLAVTHFDTGAGAARRDRERLDSASAVAVVVSLTDEPASRVRAGQVLERVWLLATHLGVAVQPMSQPLEIPRLRRKLGEAVGMPHLCPQHLFRLGYAE